ncbi:hypothetical protein [Pseudonocardia spinosispora]|uniref:hypothetical protein n=1 Tax=Pseudonocardia spinosispora TaxID=103441 RepID=UPI0004180AE8|nr:hypothetical protein [Pseudonocardia spinosispora]
MDLPAVAQQYVLLGLRAGRLRDGLVESYLGPDALRRRVEAEPRPDPAALARDAARLSCEIGGSTGPRADFLTAQLTALRCVLRRMDGVRPDFRTELRACFDLEHDVEPGEQDHYRAAHAELERLLPAAGAPLAARMAVYRKREEIPPALIAPAAQALSSALRGLTRRITELPDGEAVYYEFVTGRPWSGFAHHLGHGRSRVVVNLDAVGRGTQLAQLVAHEAYPGHHTERCRLDLARTEGLLPPERAIHLVDTPQCLVSEGLADLGLRALPGPGWGRWVESVLAQVGVRMDGELAERVERAMDALRPVRQDAALLLHRDGSGQDEALAHLRRWLLVGEGRARRTLRFLQHPLWRRYTTAYVEGYRLTSAWLDARPLGSPAAARFLRLTDEQWTPSGLRRELTVGRSGTDELAVNVAGDP